MIESIGHLVYAERQQYQKMQRSFKEIQKQKDFSLKKLKRDVWTTLGSKADMTDRIIEQHDALVWCQEMITYDTQMSWQDFNILQSMLKVVRGFKDLTELLQTKKES